MFFKEQSINHEKECRNAPHGSRIQNLTILSQVEVPFTKSLVVQSDTLFNAIVTECAHR